MTSNGRHGRPTDEDRRHPRALARRWLPGQLPFQVELPPAGLVLGIDANGMSATFPLLVPGHSTRVGVVGEVGLARLLALRLLGQSCDLTVVSRRRDEWRQLATGVADAPVAISDQLRQWPPQGSAPPWALLIDMADPPPTGFVRAAWSTVVHFAPSVPHGSGWWQSAHVVLTTRAHVREVAALRPRLDVASIDRLDDDDVVAVDHRGVTIFRPSLSRAEYDLLIALDRVSATVRP
jgi:hypothetical protein